MKQSDVLTWSCPCNSWAYWHCSTKDVSAATFWPSRTYKCAQTPMLSIAIWVIGFFFNLFISRVKCLTQAFLRLPMRAHISPNNKPSSVDLVVRYKVEQHKAACLSRPSLKSSLIIQRVRAFCLVWFLTDCLVAMERLRNMAVLERRYDTSMVGAGRVVCTVGTNSRGIYLELCCWVECCWHNPN